MVFVRLACVRPAASVHSEPGSNSFPFLVKVVQRDCLKVVLFCFVLFCFSPIKRDFVINNRRKRDLNPRLVDYDPTILTTELLRPRRDNHYVNRTTRV